MLAHCTNDKFRVNASVKLKEIYTKSLWSLVLFTGSLWLFVSGQSSVHHIHPFLWTCFWVMSGFHQMGLGSVLAYVSCQKSLTLEKLYMSSITLLLYKGQSSSPVFEDFDWQKDYSWIYSQANALRYTSRWPIFSNERSMKGIFPPRSLWHYGKTPKTASTNEKRFSLAANHFLAVLLPFVCLNPSLLSVTDAYFIQYVIDSCESQKS